jgi:hypothetical protein
MITIGLILLIICAIAMFLYMFVHSLSISKNTLLIIFTALGFAAGTSSFVKHFNMTMMLADATKLSEISQLSDQYISSNKNEDSQSKQNMFCGCCAIFSLFPSVLCECR